MKKAIFAGTFDPIHEGHIKVIKKAAMIFDEVIVVVANNPSKKSRNINFRIEGVKQKINVKNVVIQSLKFGYLADFAKKHHIKYLIRSARDITDYDYELEMAAANNHLFSELETIMIIPNYKCIKFRSSLLKIQK